MTKVRNSSAETRVAFRMTEVRVYNAKAFKRSLMVIQFVIVGSDKPSKNPHGTALTGEKKEIKGRDDESPTIKKVG
jgi:hypothetical protein